MVVEASSPRMWAGHWVNNGEPARGRGRGRLLVREQGELGRRTSWAARGGE